MFSLDESSYQSEVSKLTFEVNRCTYTHESLDYILLIN